MQNSTRGQFAAHHFKCMRLYDGQYERGNLSFHAIIKSRQSLGGRPLLVRLFFISHFYKKGQSRKNGFISIKQKTKFKSRKRVANSVFCLLFLLTCQRAVRKIFLTVRLSELNARNSQKAGSDSEPL